MMMKQISTKVNHVERCFHYIPIISAKFEKCDQLFRMKILDFSFEYIVQLSLYLQTF